MGNPYDRDRGSSRRNQGRGANFNQQGQHLQEESDLKLYGYRHYTRDRKRWLQTLAPRERWNEERRASDRIMSGKAYRHHRRILRAGKFPPETSPADPRYVQVKREVERKENKRDDYAIASVVVMLALILIAILDGALWPLITWGLVMVIGLVFGGLRS